VKELAESLKVAAGYAWSASQGDIPHIECIRLNRLAEMLTAEANGLESMLRKTA
jgi:hypothetical protein